MISRRGILRTLPGAATLLMAGTATTLLAGCGSAPTNYYRLIPVAGSVVHTGPKTVKLRGISVPAYLNQSGIAQPSASYQYVASGTSLWAGPLPDMLQSVLVQDLTQRLPQMTITASNGMIGTPPDLLIEINILRFDPDASGRIFLTAQAAIRAADGNRFLATKTLTASMAPGGTDMASSMAAMSALLGGLADDLASMVAQSAT